MNIRFGAIMLLALLATKPLAAAPMLLAVHPYLPVEELQKRFTPLAEYLGRAIRQKVEVRVGTSYDEHIHAVGGDRVDIAFMGPASYVLMTEQYGAKPLLARLVVQGQPTFAGMLFARADSPVATLKDLAGKRFAFGAFNSTMSHLVPRYMLQQAGIPLSRLAGHSFLRSHENVVLGVLAGDYDAGAVKEEVFLAHDHNKNVASSFLAGCRCRDDKFCPVGGVACRTLPEKSGTAVPWACVPVN